MLVQNQDAICPSAKVCKGEESRSLSLQSWSRSSWILALAVFLIATLLLSSGNASAQVMRIPASIGPYLGGSGGDCGTPSGGRHQFNFCASDDLHQGFVDKFVAAVNENVSFCTSPNSFYIQVNFCEALGPQDATANPGPYYEGLCIPRTNSKVEGDRICYLKYLVSGTFYGELRGQRETWCPAGHKEYQAWGTLPNGASGPVGPLLCEIRSEDVCPIGNPVSPTTGVKYLEEVDYVGPSGIELRRSYSTARLYRSGSVPIKPAFGRATWLHTYERWLHQLDPAISDGIKWMAQRHDGVVLHFRADGTEVLNRTDTGASSIITPRSDGTGWDLRLANGDVERYNLNGGLVAIATRAGLVTTLTYDSSLRVSRVSNSFGHAIEFLYDTQNRLNVVRDPAGGEIRYAYDAYGRIESVTYPDQRQRRYHYENAASPNLVRFRDYLTGITDENGQRFATYQYDINGRVIVSEHAGGTDRYEFSYTFTSGPFQTVIKDPLGTSRTYTSAAFKNVYKLATISGPSCSTCGNAKQIDYDINGNVSQRTDFAGFRTKYTFSSPRNLETSRTEAFGTPRARTITTQWHATFRLPTLITEPGRTTAFTFDTNGNQLTKTITDTATSATRTWTWTYDSYGRMLTANGPRTDVTDVTTYAYYSCAMGYQCGQLQTVTDAAFRVTTFNTYNAHGQTLTITDSNSVVTTLAYDTRQRLSSRTIGSEATTFEYWPTGLLKKVTLPDSSYLLYTYDAAHRLTRIDDGTGNYVVYTLDAMGNRTAENVYDPASFLTRTHSRVFNSLNQLWKDLPAAGSAAQTTVFGYDSNGNQTTINAPLTRNTTNQYDELNRLKQVTDPASGITQFAYDANDNLTSVTDPRTKVTSYTYTAFGDLKTQTSPDTGLTTNTYDSGGNLKTSTDARNAITTYTLDALNRVTSAAFKIGTTTDQTISFGYDAGASGIGRLTSASDANHSMSWSYDPQGRVTSKGQAVGTVTKTVGYGYTNGNLTSMTTPSGQSVLYGYNLNHQITSVSVNGTTLLSSALYDPFGPVRGWTWGNATRAVRTYDTDGKITQIDSAGLKTYGYDDAFRITGITDTVTPANSYTYGYDLLDRLTSGVKTGTTRGWTYDANGNRLTETGSAASTYMIASTNNRISSITGALPRTYAYDTAGNVLSYATVTATYNNRGRMKTLKKGTPTETIVWNALGQRVKVSGGTPGTVLYVYDEAGHFLGEYASTGALVQETVWMGDTPVATIRPGTPAVVYYVHTDHLNTPRRVTRPSDNKLMWTWYSDPFGTDLPNENPAAGGTFKYNLRFPGQLYDSHAGLNQNYFRDYDPAIGRYVESDPIGLTGDSLSTYAYVNNNPISNIDPLGLAYFGSRPLGRLPWLGPLSQNPIDDFFNTEISHEQLFFEDGKSPSNVGFFDDGELKEEPNPVGYRKKSGHYDDCIMRKTVANAPPPPSYCLIGRNCQTWADLVRKEYKRLEKDPVIQKECGLCK